jgi:hypothetical protein
MQRRNCTGLPGGEEPRVHRLHCVGSIAFGRFLEAHSKGSKETRTRIHIMGGVYGNRYMLVREVYYRFVL